MNDKFLDESLKNRMDNHISAVPADMFDRVMNARKKKRRPILWWWFGAAMFLGLAVTGYFVASNKKQNPSTELTALPNNAVDPSIQKDNNATAVYAPETNASTKTESNSTNSSATNDLNTGASTNNSTDQVTTTANDSKNKISNDATNNQQSNQQQANERNSSKQKDWVTADNNSNKLVKPFYKKQKKATPLETKKCKKEIDDFDNPDTDVSPSEFAQNSGRQKKKRTLSNTTITGEANDADETKSDEQAQNESNHLNFATQRNLQNIDPLNFADKTNYKVAPINFEKPEIPCPTYEGPGDSHWFVEAYAAPNVVSRSIKSSATASNYASKRDSTESGMLSFSAGFRIGKQFGDHFSFKTGLNYSQINETFKLNSITERRTITVITVRTITLSNGSTIQVSDTSLLEQFGTRNVNSYNSYSSLDLPLILGYGFDLGTWRVNLNVGAMFNMKAWNSGDIRSLDTLNGGIISLQNSGYYKTSFGVGWFGSVAFLKPIGDRLSLMIEPYMHLQPNNMVKDGLPFTHTYQTTGVNIGLRYRLNGGQRY